MPPTLPDLAFTIENLWSNLKKNIKNRNPKDYEELKKFLLPSPFPLFRFFLFLLYEHLELF